MAQRQRDAARANPELQSRTRACQVGEELHGRVDHRRVEQLGPERLVPLGHPLVEQT
jgi:hypothetical protein